MSIPDYQTLMLPVLQFAAEGETRVPHVADKLADALSLTEAEREELLPSGRQRILHNRIHWAKFYMGKAGLINSPTRGKFVASEAGKALLSTNPATLDVERLKTYPAFLEFYTKSGSNAGPEETPAAKAAATSEITPEEQIDAAYGVLHAALKADLLQRILAQSPPFFERVIVELLVSMGYGGSHDRAALQLGIVDKGHPQLD